MTKAPLPTGHFGADDVEIGDWVDCGATVVSAEQIIRFADLTGDRFEIHMSDPNAQKHGFDRQVAHGLLVLSLVDGLKNQAPAQFKARASKGWTWTFRAPVLAGDTVHVKLTVTEKGRAFSADQATLHLEFDVTNQDGVLVQQGRNALLAYR